MGAVEKLRELGYEVEEIGAAGRREDDSRVDLLHVAGHGVEVWVTADDAETLASLTDAEAHSERVRQEEEGPPAPPEPEPTPDERVLEALNALDPATATVADVLAAVKTALQ